MKNSLSFFSIGSIVLLGVLFSPGISTANSAIAQRNNLKVRSLSRTLLTQADSVAKLKILLKEAKQLIAQKKYQQAEQKYRQILNIVIQATSADNPKLAEIYYSLGGLNHMQQNLSAAQADYEAAVKVNPEFIPAIKNLGLIAYEAEEVDKAVRYWQSAIETNNDSSVAEAKLALAVVFYQQGQQEQGLTLSKQALSENIELGTVAILKRNLWGNKLLQATEVLLAEDRVQTFIVEANKASILNQQAFQLGEQGRYGDAEPLLKEALEMRQRLFEGDHPDVAVSLNNLAELYKAQGRYGDAEPLYLEALGMKQRLFEGDHSDVAISLNNLASLYRAQGRYADAEPLFQQALGMRQRLFEGDHFYVATSLNNLAGLYKAQGRYGKAEPLYKQALEMSQRLFPNDHFYVATSLNNLAELYHAQGRYADAEPLYQQALAMNQRLFKGDHPYVAASLHNLAGLNYTQKNYGKAEPLLKQALTMNQRLFKGDHPYVATSLYNISLLYQARSQYPQALNYLTQAGEMEEAIIAENLLIGSEQQKKQFLDKFQNNTHGTISFHLTAVPENRTAAQLALTTILRRKGRVLDSMGQALQTLRDNLDPTSEQLFVRLASTQTQLANLSSRPLPTDETQSRNIQTQQTELDKQIKTLEAQLSSRSAEFKQETTLVTIEAVQQAIPQNAALVEFIQYKPYNPKENKSSEPRYAVYVLLPNGQMKWQDLGEASTIDDRIQHFRTLLGNGAGTLLKNGDKNGDDRGLDAEPIESGIEATKEVARELDKMLMKPVRSLVGNASHLLLSPDSQLNTLPFAALVDEQDKYLVENYLITYLTSGRDLLRLQLNQDRQLTTALLMANPTYSSPGVATKSNIKVEEKDNTRGRRSGKLATLEPFQSLPGTKVEGEAISQIVPNLTVFTEQQASENNLKQTKNPQFLHLATHGFFLPPQPEEPNNKRNNTFLDLDNQTPVFSTAENPLLRSGLALAGFNQRNSGDEDGVLTALEVTGLNLRGTKLVVTSACETGLGDVQAGEGIYGLRRAFTLAGAQSQLMSLWKVSDEVTPELMVDYYTRIQNGEARGEALRQVQLEMLNSEDRNHPFFWAAFIPSGSWLPLDSSL